MLGRKMAKWWHKGSQTPSCRRLSVPPLEKMGWHCAMGGTPRTFNIFIFFFDITG